jgi:hypothetical protein
MARAAVLCGEPIAPGYTKFVRGYHRGLEKVVSGQAHSALASGPAEQKDNEPGNSGNFFLLPPKFEDRENDGTQWKDVA